MILKTQFAHGKYSPFAALPFMHEGSFVPKALQTTNFFHFFLGNPNKID